MHIKEIRQVPNSELTLLLTRIPFFKELRLRDEAQLQLLLTYSCLVELAPGETIMRRGQKGTWLYFLIKGKLIVYRDEVDPAQAINSITPGELFGDLAQLCDHQRKATVAASDDRAALLFACDFKAFGDIDNFSQIKLSTKLLFYRTVVHSIRWRLEVLRMDQPEHVLVSDLRKLPVFAGQRETLEELHALHGQAQYLANILERWNRDNGMSGELFVADAVAAS
ncbi:MAG: cyclic nucleotide-binding domain-containing protein [Spongiibacteraceae bacterium]